VHNVTYGSSADIWIRPEMGTPRGLQNCIREEMMVIKVINGVYPCIMRR